MAPNEGSCDVGPMEAAIKIRLPLAASAIASLAILTAAVLTSLTLSANPYSLRVILVPPKVFVSITSQPALI